jgi:DnaJ-class molecular chaperone
MWKDEDAYQILGIGKECTEKELKKAFKKKALGW